MAQAVTVDVIGDDILYNGQLVALLVSSGVPFSVLDDFRWDLLNGTFQEELGQDKLEGSMSQGFDRALDSVRDSVAPYSKGGLVKLADVLKVLGALKKEGWKDE